VLTVGQLARRVRSALEDNLKYVWVSGEASGVAYAPSGHLYFDLKDEEDDPPAVIRCTMWRPRVMRLRFRVENGMSVLVLGLVTAYAARSQYQLNVEQIEPQGVGALHLKFEQLKEKLSKEGLFDPDRKRPIPFLPRRIAIVTSPTGAAVQDMARTLRTRCPIVEVVIHPVRVQGEGAAEEIAAAIFAADADVLIVGRGGGSIEDLWAFNEEVVARAIRASRIPVISAVGHETDTTIADFAADVRALTPTDGAVRAVPKLDELLDQVEDLGTKLRRALRTRAELSRSALDGFRGGRAFGRVEEMPSHLAQRLDELQERLKAAMGQAPRLLRERCLRLDGMLHAHLPRAVERATARLREAAGKLEMLSPKAILGRGYSITRLESGRKILKDARQARPGDRIVSILASGTLTSKVERTGEQENR
jgi:exodeoxyribonuclease VII large subunit